MTKLSKETIKEVLSMREAGKSWKKIQEHFGVSYHTLKCATDPEYARKRAEENARRNKVIFKGEVHSKAGSSFLPKEKVEERRAWLNREDTRDLTGILLGDPLPGRSALERRGEE